jgi:hypothetical protein
LPQASGCFNDENDMKDGKKEGAFLIATIVTMKNA